MIDNLEDKLRYYQMLDERQKRLYLGMEAKALGRSGVRVISERFGVDPKTVRQGKKDFEQPVPLKPKQIRSGGGGRKKKLNSVAGLERAFLRTLDAHTAGDPMQESVKWTELTQQQIADKLAEKGFFLTRRIVKQLLDKHEYKKRKMHKTKTLGEVAQRDEQFRHIAKMKEVFLQNNLPVFSIDTKKKELLGNFYRQGSRYASAATEVNDHDFKNFATGQIVPHGIYDVAQNKGYLTLGLSRDTSEFVCDNMAHFWQQDFQWRYAEAPAMLLLCDGGGSNNCRHHIVKQELVRLANELKINILVAHYPPYCSKWNPIEHRLFCHISHAWQGVVFQNVQIVKELAEKTSTKTGLQVNVWLNKKNYSIGRLVESDFKDNMSDFIIFDDKLPQWNYLIKYSN